MRKIQLHIGNARMIITCSTYIFYSKNNTIVCFDVKEFKVKNINSSTRYILKEGDLNVRGVTVLSTLIADEGTYESILIKTSTGLKGVFNFIEV